MALQKIGLEAILKMTQFNRGVRQYTKGVTGMGKTTASAAKGMKGLGNALGGLTKVMGVGVATFGAVAAAAVTVKKALDFGKEGAVVQQTTDSFNELMDAMGVGPGLLDEMSAATNNTVDDMTLMSSTMTLLAGTSDNLGRAMVGNAPKLLEIAKAANKLNPTLGNTAFLYQSLATGIKRSSPLILDNLGIVIKVGEANEKWAEKMGTTVEAMDAEEKQMALLEAALKAGDRMIQQVGGSTDSATDSYEQLTAEVTNLTNELKRKANPQIAAATKVTLEWVDALLFGIENTKILADEILYTSDSYEEYIDAVLDAAVANHQLSDAEVEHIKKQIEQGEEVHRSAVAMGVLTEAQYASLRAVTKLAGGIDNFSEAVDPYTEMAREAARATLGLAIAETDAIETTANLAQVLSADATAAAAGFKSELDILNAAISGAVGKAFQDLTTEIWELRGSLADGTITMEEYRDGIEKSTDAFRDNTNAIIYNIASKQILDALEKGLIEDVNASGTAYDEATVALYAMAEGLGIVDEGTLGLTRAVIEQTDRFISGKSTLDDYIGGLGGLSGKLIEAATHANTLGININNLPSYKKITIEYYMSTTGTGPPSGEGGPGYNPPQPIPYQHGGPVGARQPTIVGEAGPELFIPDRPGQIIPNDWSMNLPAGAGGGGSGFNLGPTVNLRQAVTIKNGMDVAEFQALTLTTVQQALRGS